MIILFGFNAVLDPKADANRKTIIKNPKKEHLIRLTQMEPTESEIGTKRLSYEINQHIQLRIVETKRKKMEKVNYPFVL